MTREEAIQSLKDLAEINVRYGCDDKWIMALNMAIEALSEPNRKPDYSYEAEMVKRLKAYKQSGDLISRAEAMAEFREWVKRANENGETPTWNDAVSLIGSLPSAEQVTSKLNNPCDSLLTDESNGSKEHKSKLDLISRQDVIEALCRSSVYAWSIEQDQTAHDWALNIINALPSADAVQGEWEDKEVFNETDDDHIVDEWQSARCSVCGKYHTTPYMYYFDNFNFCPNCGAKMDGERREP